MKGFRSFLAQGSVVVVAVGLVIALAFSTLVDAFAADVIDPIITRAQGQHAAALGWQLGRIGNLPTFVNIGAFVSAIIYFIIFMLVVYFVIVVPYRRIAARRGQTVFGPAPPVKTCPACLSDDLPAAASKCKYCATEQPPVAGTAAVSGG